MTTVIDVENYVEFGKMYKKKCADLKICVDDGIIGMINYMKSIDTDVYEFMIAELKDCLKKCEIFTEM
ncbi:hypothetical protein ECANGB1_2348 [Enterospora canceri]|uniref:Uncharacterized protein n=1 Tax=Enterospora canceri TaxID=1081671 RepID=A0A1Y1S998_9MICR|nr:hypothetical protein ECANGB1_2348 [Enterospora canceri]